MGILETRAIDFKNIIYLSITDENFPSAYSPTSFIPQNLRQGYSLPSFSDHLAMYAYYFYRSLQRCENAVLIYSSSNSGQKTGEQSRYIYQLEFESPHKITRRNINLKLPESTNSIISVHKSEQIINKLADTKFSPSNLNDYITCTLRFYFAKIAYIQPTAEIDQKVDRIKSGNILHRAIEHLYTPYKGQTNPQTILKQLLKNDNAIEKAVDTAISQVLGIEISDIEKSGSLRIIKHITVTNLRRIVAFDSQREESYEFYDFEHNVEHSLQLSDSRSIVLRGVIDRIDKGIGDKYYIIDYKSGGDSLSYNSIDELFSDNPDLSDRSDLSDNSASGLLNIDSPKFIAHNKAALQMLLYSVIINESFERVESVTPMLYVTRLMYPNSPFTAMLYDKNLKQDISDLNTEYLSDIKSNLSELLNNMFDLNIPFTQTPNLKSCQYCNYKDICQR